MGSVYRRLSAHPGQAALGLIGLAFTASYIVFFYLFRDAREIADASLDGYLEVVLLGLPTVTLFGAVLWLSESPIDEDFYTRVPRWTAGVSVLAAAAVSTVVFVIEATFDPGEWWLTVLMSSGLGATAGTVMGVLKIRALQNERDRNRMMARAHRRERERERLEHLNHYLRHEVLNEAQKITGYATMLEGTDVGGNPEYLVSIRQSADEIAEFVKSIRSILEASDFEPELRAVEVVSVLESEVERLRRSHHSARITVRGAASAHVRAGDLVNRVFNNLLENAVAHNDQNVSITVSVETEQEWVTVRLRDDGSGIDPADRERLFEPPESGDHGYGLFLTNTIVETYGGRLELVDTGPGGTEFAVRLRQAAADPSRNGREASAIVS